MVAAASLAVAQQASTPAQPADQVAGLAEWQKVFEVFSHPRCANCHVETDRPVWSGPHYGGERVHALNVRRGEDGFGSTGLKCSSCHSQSNSSVLHGPPGAPNWHLAPVEMVWFDKSSAHICAQIKDPARNGGKTLEQVAIHVRDDALVAWGWDPGPGRQPAPGSPESTYEALVRWTELGAPCPSGE